MRLGERYGRRSALFIGVMLLLAGCATASPVAVQPASPGFLLGVVHGVIAPFSFVASLFNEDVAIYSVPNRGSWYDFGFLLGVGAFSGSAAAGKSRIRRR